MPALPQERPTQSKNLLHQHSPKLILAIGYLTLLGVGVMMIRGNL